MWKRDRFPFTKIIIGTKENVNHETFVSKETKLWESGVGRDYLTSNF